MSFIFPHARVSDPLRPQRFAIALSPGARIVRREDWRTVVDAQRLLQDANEQAQAIRAEAEQERETQRERGYDEGMAQAREDWAAETMTNLAAVVAFQQRCERQMVDVVMQAVRRIVASFDDAQAAEAVVGGALAVVRHQKRVFLRVGAGSAERVRAHLDGLMQRYPAIDFADVIADPKLADDACVAESDLGLVECAVSSQLESLELALRKVFPCQP